MDATRNKDALGMGVALYNILLCVEILELLLLPGIFSEHGIYGSFHNQILTCLRKLLIDCKVLLGLFITTDKPKAGNGNNLCIV